jgi:GNAT superfamily N-acetyltransferase
MATVRRFAPHEWRAYRDLRLRALADSPDAFASTLLAEQRHEDDHWKERLSSGATSAWNLPLVTEGDAGPAGLAWGRIDPAQPETAHVYQMWVAPEARGAGCGTMLLQAILDWARDAGARTVLLHVTRGNDAAARVYSRAGFAPVGEPEPLRSGSALLSQRMRLELP